MDFQVINKKRIIQANDTIGNIGLEPILSRPKI